ncbi:MAG: hypothetical protein OXC28_19610 [Defluviicoccus sp.]|nr:hypothetical protein [Defluviicoccus sp.]
MDPVQITMLGVGVALAALVVTMNGSLRRDMDKRFDAIEKRFDDRIDGIEKRLEERFDGIDKRLDGIDARLRLVEQGLAEVKGRLAFVESFILGRTETAAGEAPAK